MAFEDRSSPNAAVSASPNSPNIPTSPVANCIFPYTCTTLPLQSSTSEALRNLQYTIGALCATSKSHPDEDESTKNFLRITTYALSSQKNTLIPPPPSQNHLDTVKDERRSPQIVPQNAPKFCIDNILQPDFGKSAVQRTKSSGKITFKPYELTHRSSGNNSEEEDLPSAIAPLGSLCQTVSQIGKLTGCVSSAKSPSASEPIVPKRSRSPAESSGSSVQGDGDGASSKSGEDGKVPTLWPAWVYCTRYSDRPSSG